MQNMGRYCCQEIKRCLPFGRKAMTNLDCIEKQRHHLADKGPYSQSYGFSNSHVWVWELDHKEGCVEEFMFLNCGVAEDSWESLGLQGDPTSNPKGNQWIFTGRTDAEAETPILCPPHAKSWLIWKDPDVCEDWRQEEKGMTEDEMVGWHHRHNGHGFGWTPGVGDEQGGLECCGSWGCSVGHNWATELNWTER